jgi:hypothetical protein
MASPLVLFPGQAVCAVILLAHGCADNSCGICETISSESPLSITPDLLLLLGSLSPFGPNKWQQVADLEPRVEQTTDHMEVVNKREEVNLTAALVARVRAEPNKKRHRRKESLSHVDRAQDLERQTTG